jgi:hypothetical protein
MVVLLSLLIPVMGDRELTTRRPDLLQDIIPISAHCKAIHEYFLVFHLNKYGYLIPWTLSGVWQGK